MEVGLVAAAGGRSGVRSEVASGVATEANMAGATEDNMEGEILAVAGVDSEVHLEVTSGGVPAAH